MTQPVYPDAERDADPDPRTDRKRDPMPHADRSADRAVQRARDAAQRLRNTYPEFCALVLDDADPGADDERRAERDPLADLEAAAERHADFVADPDWSEYPDSEWSFAYAAFQAGARWAQEQLRKAEK